MPRVHSKLTHKKKSKLSKYIGVDKTKDGWIVKMSIAGKKYVYGPFDDEISAAKFYDTKALESFKRKVKTNILHNPYVQRTNAKRTYTKKTPKKECKIVNHKRVKFSVVTKNKICSRQKWSCNYCGNLLSDIFIVDHVVPLFLGGSNSEHNLQALCPSCDRFKTSYLDYKVIKPMSEEKDISVDDVFKIQNDNYHKMMCIDPKINDVKTMNFNCNQYISKNEKKGLELNINGMMIKIQV
jgi:5-methylcytosine-specific restriction endonuclease McrA